MAEYVVILLYKVSLTKSLTATHSKNLTTVVEIQELFLLFSEKHSYLYPGIIIELSLWSQRIFNVCEIVYA